MNTDSNKPDAGNSGDRVRKRKYVKPAFRHEAVFETMALACGKLSGTTSACNALKKLS